MTSDTPRRSYICATCDSDAVIRDAWAEWNIARQEWIVSEIFPFAFCHSCQRQTKLVMRPLS